MKNKKIKFSKKEKKDLSDNLYRIAEKNELLFKQTLEEKGIDTANIKIVDRAKFTTKYIPDVLEELLEKYGTSKILMNDENIQKEALDSIQRRFHEDLSKQAIKKWNIYYILRHCKILEPIIIDENIKLVPFNGLSCNDYLEVIDKVFYNIGPPASRRSEEIYKEIREKFIKMHSEKNPISLLILKEIIAKTEKEVYELTKKYVENVMLCTSNLINSSIELGGWVTEGILEGFKQIHPTIYFSHYNPIYMESKELEETLKIFLNNIDDNYLLKLALKYENEALYENEVKFSILKRWSVIEFIADEYSQRTSKKLLTKQELKNISQYIKTIIDNKNNVKLTLKLEDKIITNVSQINYKNAKDKVRDLILWAGHPMIKMDDSEKDIIDVIYQHRNCIVHRGGCFKNDGSILEECTGTAYCKKNNLDIKQLNGELSRIIARIIGKFVNIEFEFQSEIPEQFKRSST